MNERLQLLIDLQKVDSQTRSEENMIKEITEKINYFEEQVRIKESELKEEEDELALKEKELRGKERSLEDVNLHLQKCRERVYMVKNAKELAALDEEITKVKKEKSVLEDENLALMEAIEEIAPKVKAEGKALEEEKNKLLTEKKNCEGVLNQAQEKVNILSRERNGVTGKLDKVLLAEYDKFYRTKGSFGVTAMKDGVCMGCHVAVSAHLVNEVRKNEQIIRCENCARILYYPDTI